MTDYILSRSIPQEPGFLRLPFFRLPGGRAQIAQRAFPAQGMLGFAYAAAMPYQAVMHPPPLLPGHQPGHLLLCFFHGIRPAQPQPVGHPEHMGIHREGGNSESV